VWQWQALHNNFGYFLHWFLPFVMAISLLLPKHKPQKEKSKGEPAKTSTKAATKVDKID
jgi:hypothetical protein